MKAQHPENLVGQIVSVGSLGTTHLALVVAHKDGLVTTLDRWGGQSVQPRDAVWSEGQRRAYVESNFTKTPQGRAALQAALAEFDRVNAEGRRAVTGRPECRTKPQELKLGEPQNRLYNRITRMWYSKDKGNFSVPLKSQATVLDPVETAVVQAQFENVCVDTIVLTPHGAGRKPYALQVFHAEGAQVRIGRNRAGELCAEIYTGEAPTVLPVELLGLAAGKDAWMRRIMVRCADCGARVPAGEMECRLCPECLEKAEKENARLDAGE